MNTHAGESGTTGPEGPVHGRGTFLAAALRAAAGYLGLWFGLLLCGAMFLGWAGIAFAVSPFFATEQRRRVGRTAMQRMFQLCLKVLHFFAIVEIDNTALLALRDERSLILAPNHPSMLDVVLVISRLDNVGCIMKAELWDNIFLGAGARMAGFIRNDSPLNTVRLAVRDLKCGSQLLIFPEATRTVRAPVNALSGGCALIAKKANVPIQTILIETDSPYLRKGWPLFRRPPMPIRFRLTLGQRFQPRDDVDSLVADMEHYYIEKLDKAARVPVTAPAHAEPPKAAGELD